MQQKKSQMQEIIERSVASTMAAVHAIVAFSRLLDMALVVRDFAIDSITSLLAFEGNRGAEQGIEWS